MLLVGDAAGYVDALTGEGVAVGLATARLAVAAIAAGRPEDYPAAWARGTRRYRCSRDGAARVADRPGTAAPARPGRRRGCPASSRCVVDSLA